MPYFLKKLFLVHPVAIEINGISELVNARLAEELFLENHKILKIVLLQWSQYSGLSIAIQTEEYNIHKLEETLNNIKNKLDINSTITYSIKKGFINQFKKDLFMIGSPKDIEYYYSSPIYSNSLYNKYEGNKYN